MPRLCQGEPEIKASWQEANRIVRLYFIAQSIQAVHFRTSIKGALFFLGSVVVIRGASMMSGIDHFIHIMSAPVSLIISLSKWEKWSYVTLWA